ncbi:MAG TPA: alpha/beta hydrolase [Polyangiaceae bacterium]|jgi:pimeloyl-ACP methyl ester carboxylesterase|nr:alpha/beta hydrolase [Polyangiaceae bacterium]
MPDSLKLMANGLEHHVLEWLPEAPSAEATVVLLHGYMDAAATWETVAPSLTAAGFRVLAPDLRGYGDGARVPPGGYYHFTDYVFDLADLVDQLVPQGTPLLLVGHSMGGTIANMYAGSFPERLTRLVLLEGAGPPDNAHEVAPDRMRKWVDDVRALRGRPPRRMASREEALRRLVGNHPRVAEDVLRQRLDALSRELPDGGLAWKADPLHGTRSPVPFFAAGWSAFARRVTCPVLFVSGGPLGWHPDDEETRVSAFATLQRAEIPGAGHMMHWTQPAKLTRLLLQFFAGDVIPGALSP